MTKLVNTDKIETIVSAKRHPTLHLGKAVSAENTVYILHSQHCKNTTPDLRECQYSIALDHGIDPIIWNGCEDQPMVLTIDPDHQDLTPERPHKGTP